MGMSFVAPPPQQTLVSSIIPYLDEVIGSWRKLHNEELHNFYPSPSIIRIIKSMRIRSPWHVAHKGKKMNAYRILVAKPEGKSTRMA
jgi:hypothetical protein